MSEDTVVTVRGNESVALGMERLVANSITSVPVFDVREERYNAFMSSLDICAHTLTIYNDTSIPDADKLRAWKAATCSQVANLSKTCSFLYSQHTDNLQTVVLKMVTLSNIRRLPVMNLKDDLVGILSQSQIINILAEKIDLFPIAQLTIEDINLGTLRHIKSVNLTSLVKDAFTQLVEHHIYGIPVVDEKNTVVGNISASDIQLIVSIGEFSVSKFELPIKDVLQDTHQKRNPIVIKVTQTVSEAFKIMSKEKIHRLFVVDNKSALIGLISPVDLLQVLLDHTT